MGVRCVVDVFAVDIDRVGHEGRAAVAVACVALLQPEELNLLVDAVEEAETHGDGIQWDSVSPRGCAAECLATKLERCVSVLPCWFETREEWKTPKKVVRRMRVDIRDNLMALG